ncbi:MAG: hypothetical protein AB7O96_00830 [Pseudobdellovibrionaceae bacterium]
MDKIWPFIKFCLYTFAYLLGKKDVIKEMESLANKRALERITSVLEKQELTRDKYERIKKNLPNSWVDYDSTGRVRKTNKN